MLGKRWTLQILESVGSKKAMRFCEIKKALTVISGTMLSERLVELEREGLVTKNIQNSSSKTEYMLTARARELVIMLAELDRWWSVHHQACRPVIASYQ